jgi:hypothetical protein
VVEPFTVEPGGQDVEPRVRAAAGRERLEPQPLAAAGDDRIAVAAERPVERLAGAAEVGTGDVGQRQQPHRGCLTRGEETGEEPRIGEQAAFGAAAGRLQDQPSAEQRRGGRI